jgi:hypothetical protein
VRIERNGGQITIRDRPGPFWVLGLMLLAGGLVAVAMPLAWPRTLAKRGCKRLGGRGGGLRTAVARESSIPLNLQYEAPGADGGRFCGKIRMIVRRGSRAGR